jgi:hypothetical protein
LLDEGEESKGGNEHATDERLEDLHRGGEAVTVAREEDIIPAWTAVSSGL